MMDKKSSGSENSNQKSFKALKEMVSDVREGLKGVHDSLSGFFFNGIDEGKKDIGEDIRDIEEILEIILALENASVLNDFEGYREIHEGLYHIKKGFNDVNEGLKDISKGIYTVHESLNDILKDNIPESMRAKRELFTDIDESGKDTLEP